MLAELQQLGDEVGQPPSMSDMIDHGQHSPSTYQARFDSWYDALEAAGFDCDRPSAPVTRDQLLADLQRLADEHGEPVTTSVIDTHGQYSISTYFRTFESLATAREAAGLDSGQERATGDIDTETLLAEFERVADTVDGRPTIADITEHGQYSASPYRDRFGSWTAALEAAGYDPASVSEGPTTRDELLADLQRLADEHGKPVRTTDIREHGNHSTTTIIATLTRCRKPSNSLAWKNRHTELLPHHRVFRLLDLLVLGEFGIGLLLVDAELGQCDGDQEILLSIGERHHRRCHGSVYKLSRHRNAGQRPALSPHPLEVICRQGRDRDRCA
ncbi:homing endonuclease associated repeat-containing protein [Natrinema sp. CBA1119]|uniref:homing endonuclease associated repeat-containing protein n=1 Tax=Natrinema sp. CBA1119 TaxID=1608465 RepID=UPI0020D27CFE|nr:hypothetical protein [Natrinema sp. CBA1119]